MSDPMQGIAADVPFDFGAASALISACRAAATKVDSERASHAAWVRSAMTDFRGHYSQLFQANGHTADNDARELASALRSTATGVGKLVEDAKAEQSRRQRAREWKQQHDHRGFMGWLDDTFGDGDDCPIPAPQPQLRWSAPTPPATTRHTPAPGTGGGGGGGTSSARPEDLHTFATKMGHSHTTLSTNLSQLRTKYSSFVQGCHWGQLSADGVLSGYATWLRANHNDARWAKVVGDAFAAAGSEGQVSTLPDSAIHSALRSAGVSGTRKDLTIAMPSVLGHPPTTGYANDPVNTSTGNFIETEVDLEFLGASGDLGWRRSYNSMSVAPGAFGRGWSSWCEAGLSFTDDSAAFRYPDGRHAFFPRLGEGWDRAAGENLWLDRRDVDGAQRLVVTGNDGTSWECDGSGRLLRHVTGQGRAVDLLWDQDRLVGLTHQRGRAIRVEWDADRVVGVVASDGRSIGYTYEDGRLVAATGPLGTRRYLWNESGLIESVVDADGVVEVVNAYDEAGRVVRQQSPFGRVTRFAYLPGLVTVVSDQDGSRANTWLADQRGRLVGIIDAHDQRQSMSYDAHGNRVMSTDRDGELTVNEYDERGRKVREVAPNGADVVYSYDEADRLVRVEVTGGDPMVDGDEDGAAQTSVTTYDYLGDQRSPSVVTDPEGGVTRLEWADGLLQQMTDPTGVVVSLGYDEHGDLVSTTDAAGNTARLERDETGRVTAAITPSGRRTAYTYDPESGLATQRVDPDGATWRYDYTAAGRPAVIVAPDGGRTEIEYAQHGEESATIDPLGRAMRRTYDDLGHVASALLPDGSRWEFLHDALGRMTDVIDPTGARQHTDHDVNGAPSAVTDPTGVRREIHDVHDDGGNSPSGVETVVGAGGPGATHTRLDVDRLGRLVSETQADGTTRLTRYDRCGRPVEVIDPIGGLTRMHRDAAGRVLTLVKPSGAEIGYTYDECGRLSTITDETGATSRRVYDADSRVVEQHLPTGEVATTRYDECGRVVALRIPGVGTRTYDYDANGRVIATRDPSNGWRRFRYDAAGQLVEAVDGNGGATAYDYDANGRCVSITHPDGGVTRREFNARNQVTAETDPLGRTTRAEYDAAGRQLAQIDPAGSRIEWRYDDQGRLASTWVDGVEQSAIERDLRGRRMRITDRSGAGGAVVVHELEWDPRGLLVSRTRDGRGPSWEYDADGRCVALTGPSGERTGYARDAAGRLVGVSHPLLGNVVIERDAAGRMASATAGPNTQRWSYRDGFVVGHEAGGHRTRIVRDEIGRITQVEPAGGPTTSYSYDRACQLVAAATTTDEGTETLRWRYDAAGRLVAETVDLDGHEVIRTFEHDRAGQLTVTRVGGEQVAAYSYDAAGRRISESYADGSGRDLSWSPLGWLASVSSTDRLGDTHRTDLVVDALGELARIEGPDGAAEAFADTADPWRGLLEVGEIGFVRGGPFTGTTGASGGESPGSWEPQGWREARSVGPDPWSLPTEGVPDVPQGPARAAGLEVTASGDLLIAGLEWLGSRVYDPTTRGFVSVDPLDPTTGAGWAGNPYSYAGNDPLHAVDPLGLHPVTDAELKAYNAHNGGFMDTAAGKWLKNNWEYVAGGLMVVGGVALMFAPFPGAQNLGMGLASAGADTIIQKATTGEVNWKEVAVSGALGALPGAGEGLAVKAGMKSGWKAAVAGGAFDGAWQGGVGGGVGYMTGPGPHTASGLVSHVGVGAAEGTGTGALFGGVSHGAQHLRQLGHTPATPPHPEPQPSSARFVVGSDGVVTDTRAARFVVGSDGVVTDTHAARFIGAPNGVVTDTLAHGASPAYALRPRSAYVPAA